MGLFDCLVGKRVVLTAAGKKYFPTMPAHGVVAAIYRPKNDSRTAINVKLDNEELVSLGWSDEWWELDE